MEFWESGISGYLALYLFLGDKIIATIAGYGKWPLRVYGELNLEIDWDRCSMLGPFVLWPLYAFVNPGIYSRPLDNDRLGSSDRHLFRSKASLTMISWSLVLNSSDSNMNSLCSTRAQLGWSIIPK
ncbi:uncharacterized protein BDR25DRAFT_350159 [Lindgomyces ingoldianus]|uniref:Uncharacterized protein n=1 Tax=Lindgomyces ingoldianus TaxID=673940 RepID=A0ACB6R9Y2_9PLEO|nr:uncharacterized protein BDR25DRAFT_350159 [Lindgomyces ingoldianus]KAF2475892.1 hypothetical protein BDR25DRAFT_350159 [Lindgomyces ingoldianus]